MLSEKQLAANRANAQRSTGPRSPEGKRRSSLNACRHNLTGQVTAMTPEDRAACDKFSAGLIRSLAPEGDFELQLAQRIATDSWRLNRAGAIEDNLFALGLSEHADETGDQHPEVEAAFANAKTWQSESAQLQLLTLYEQRLNRAIHRNLATLQALQATRRAEQRRQMEEATRLLQLSEKKGHRYEPTKDGFVFSTDEIRAAADRQRRLAHAQSTDFEHRKHHTPQKLKAQAA
jgi:hypothetical protein